MQKTPTLFSILGALLLLSSNTAALCNTAPPDWTAARSAISHEALGDMVFLDILDEKVDVTLSRQPIAKVINTFVLKSRSDQPFAMKFAVRCNVSHQFQKDDTCAVLVDGKPRDIVPELMESARKRTLGIKYRPRVHGFVPLRFAPWQTITVEVTHTHRAQPPSDMEVYQALHPGKRFFTYDWDTTETYSNRQSTKHRQLRVHLDDSLTRDDIVASSLPLAKVNAKVLEWQSSERRIPGTVRIIYGAVKNLQVTNR